MKLSLKWSIILQLLAGIFFGITNQVKAEITPSEINSIARQTTVLIAPGLTKDLINEIENNRNNPYGKEGVWNPGSGVIIAKQNNTYYVLTVAHNFPQRFLDKNVPFGIRTSDRQVHILQNVNDGRGCPLAEPSVLQTLIRFGCRLPGNDVRGYDLALVSFLSEKSYPVASLGDSSTIKKGDKVYISGWPDPEKELIPDTSKCQGRVVKRQRRLAWGAVSGQIKPTAKTLGYSIFYTDNTRAGMSGGPVFDSNGFLVGNHGVGRSSKPKCGIIPSQLTNTGLPKNHELEEELGHLEEDLEPEVENAPDSEEGSDFINEFESGDEGSAKQFKTINRDYSGSQNINFSLQLFQKLGLNLALNFAPPSAAMIRAALKPIEANGQDGKVEFDATADAFDDPNDTEKDVYKLFSFGLQNQLRNQPSGGCGSVLLGDRCN